MKLVIADVSVLTRQVSVMKMVGLCPYEFIRDNTSSNNH